MRHLLAVGAVIAGVIAIVAVSAFVGASLGTSAADLSRSSSERTGHPVAVGATRFRSPDGYSFLLPSGWSASPMDDVREQLLRNALRAADTGIARLVDRVLEQTHGRISMVGGDLHAGSASSAPANVSVIAEPATTSAAEALLEVRAALGSMSEVSGLTAVNSTVGSVAATRVDWSLSRQLAGTSGAPMNAVLSTYVVPGTHGVFILTIGRGADATDRQVDLEDALVRSFQVEQTAGS